MALVPRVQRGLDPPLLRPEAAAGCWGSDMRSASEPSQSLQCWPRPGSAQEKPSPALTPFQVTSTPASRWLRSASARLPLRHLGSRPVPTATPSPQLPAGLPPVRLCLPHSTSVRRFPSNSRACAAGPPRQVCTWAFGTAFGTAPFPSPSPALPGQPAAKPVSRGLSGCLWWGRRAWQAQGPAQEGPFLIAGG